MKSIKEKAEEYGYTNWQSDEYHDGASEDLEFDAIGHTQKTFEAGANYVLEEIKNILSHPLKYVHSNKSVEERMIADIANIIKQLKK